ncbi:hypothetical protein HDU67_002750 [Dinochytrium kinnereticum]|nr:hypothetical protein HDU67_002750 [Dinochytrium kinnereticum]
MSSVMSITEDAIDIPAQMEAHRQREQEKDAIHRRVIMDGMKMAGIFTAGSGGLSLLAQRYIPLYRSQKLPFKLFIVMAFGTGAFFTEADRSAMRADREFAMRFSVTREGDLSQPAPTMTRLTGDELLKAAVRNRFEVVGYTWLGTFAGTLFWNFQRADIAMAQKLINARMTAQVAAILGFAAAGTLAAMVPKEATIGEFVGSRVFSEALLASLVPYLLVSPSIDPYYERIINGNQAPQKAT